MPAREQWELRLKELAGDNYKGDFAHRESGQYAGGICPRKCKWKLQRSDQEAGKEGRNILEVKGGLTFKQRFEVVVNSVKHNHDKKHEGQIW